MIGKIIVQTSVVICIFSAQSKAQQFINGKIDVIAGSEQYMMNCVFYKPANFDAVKKYPLVLFFHGMAQAGTDINKMYEAGLPKVLKDGYRPPFDFIMVAPQHNSYSLNPQHLEQVLNESIRLYPNVDQGRVYITGNSAGGNTIYCGSLNIKKELPKRFAAMVVISGATQGVNKDNFPWWKEFRTPLWALTGETDVSYTGQNQYVVDEVNKQVPGLASITIRPGVAHEGWEAVYSGMVLSSGNKNMWQWMYQFSRASTGTLIIGGSTTTNSPPIANGGADKSIVLPSNSVQLAGSGSDPDGSIVSYLWTKISGPAQYSLSSSSSQSITVSNLVEGSYTFRLTVKDNSGATGYDDVVVTVNRSSSSSGSKEIRVNIFGGSNPYNNAQWNNWNTFTSLTSANFKYSDGSASGIKARLSSQNSVSDNGTSYTTTMAPNEVLRYTSYATSIRTLVISGLSNTKTYELEIYASRNGNSNNITRFAIANSYVDIRTGNNFDKIARFTTTPVNGTITVELRNLYTYNYINAFVLKE